MPAVPTTFFASIREYFKTKYDGRYFSIILHALAQHEPESFNLLVKQIAATSQLAFWREISKDLMSGELAVEREKSFHGDLKQRRADLAIVRGETTVVLVEVKEFDHRNPENPDQLADYLRVVSARLGFIHVHRFLPPTAQSRKIELKRRHGWPVAMLSYDQIYAALKDSKDEGRALGALICHYLEDIGVGIYREIENGKSKALAFLMAQLLGFPSRAGIGKLQSEATVRQGPQLVTTLLGDMEVIGEWLRHSNEEIMRTRCSTRFYIEPWLNHKKLRKDIRDSGDEVADLPAGFRQYVGGGHVYFVANGSLRDGHMDINEYINVELGFAFELEKAASSVRFYVYTCFYGRHFDGNDTYEGTDYLKKFPKEHTAFDLFKSCLVVSRRKTLKLTTGPSKAILKKLVIP